MKLDKCLVCDHDYAVTWTDYHGEAACLTCGTPYIILESGQEITPEINLLHADAMLPVLRRYWSETKRRNGLGTYLVPPRQDIIQQTIAFNEWVEAQPELLAQLQALEQPA